jgi:aspartyl-tRNA(Asn)/glutamyl-tRNA(Gln) amidotransferase subunit A
VVYSWTLEIFFLTRFLVGLPALVFPFGNSREDGFPIGLQLIAQYGDDEFLFDFAEVFEENVRKGTKK